MEQVAARPLFSSINVFTSPAASICRCHLPCWVVCMAPDW